MAKRRKRRGGAGEETAAAFVSVGQALAVLEVLAVSRDGMTPQDLAAQVGAPLWAIERVVASLREVGVVTANRERPRLSLKMVALAYGFMWALDWKQYYMDALETLSETTGELAQIAVVNGDVLVGIDKVEGRNALRVASVLGTDIPLHATAGGKLWLASLDDTALDRALRRRPLEAFSDRTITIRAALAAELARIRAQGYSDAHEEYFAGVSAVAAPIRPEGQDIVVGVVSLAFPSSVSAEVVERYAGATMEAAAALKEFGIRVHEELGGQAGRERRRPAPTSTWS